MSIRIDHVGDVAVVVTEGIFTGGPETDELESTLRGLIEEPGRRKILLNLSGTRLMLSLAIGVLMAAHVDATSRGIRFYVCGISPGLRKVLETIKAQPKVLNHFDDCSEALETLQRA
ncbi:MAG: STAS domain-containing protein [Candidatus Latescibacterota bacterium]|nr:MAG: STAS domain-containing protein [Candidatus Latescibacterota bacterium]